MHALPTALQYLPFIVNPIGSFNFIFVHILSLSFSLTHHHTSAGNWSVACRTNFHLLTGMTAKYEVKACGSEPEPWQTLGVTRRYYVAAEEVLWDYVPLRRDPVTGQNFTDDSQ